MKKQYQSKEQEILNQAKTVSKLESLSAKEKIAVLKFLEKKHVNIGGNW